MSNRGGSLTQKCKKEKGVLLLWNGFLVLIRGFECVENQVLSTYCKSAQCTKSVSFRVRLTKTSHCNSWAFFFKMRELNSQKHDFDNKHNFENVSKKRYIRYTLYPVFVIPGLRLTRYRLRYFRGTLWDFLQLKYM